MSVLRALWIALLFLGVATSATEASTGLRVVGDSRFRVTAEQRIAAWLASHGHEITEKAFGQAAYAVLDECYLRDEPACANKYFAANGDADLFLYVNFEVIPSGKGEQTVRGTLWVLRKEGEAGIYLKDCNRCDDNAAAAMVDALVARVGSFNAKAGTLRLSSAPTGATVLIDGREEGVTPFEQEVEAGSHEVVVRRAGYSDERRTIVIGTEGVTEQLVTLHRREGSGTRRLVTYVTAGTGLALLAGGITALFLHEGEPCSPTKKQCLVSRPAGLAALAGASVMLGVAGYLWLTTDDPEPTPTTALQPRVRTYTMGWGGTF